jgi:hypothetical protein
VDKLDISFFKNRRGESIDGLFDSFISFAQKDAPSINSYYNKELSTYPTSSFDLLAVLTTSVGEWLDVIPSYKNSFNSLKWFDIVAQIEEIDHYLATLNKTPKWLRLSQSTNNYKNSIQKVTIQEQNQTIEKSIQNNNAYETNDTDWINIAYQNRLLEQKYTLSGGSNFIISYNTPFRQFDNKSVVDVMGEDTIYGKDIDRHFSFVDNDIKTLNTNDTLVQSASILIALNRGSNPEYPTEGIQRNLIVGNNYAQFSFPLLVRQWQSLFNDDSTFKSININKIDFDSDIININFTINTLIDESITESFKNK